MNKKIIFLLLFHFISSTILSQNKSIVLLGKVVDSIGKVNNVNILNLSSSLGTASNKDGLFEMKVRLGDSLQISSIQHFTKIIYVGKRSIKSKKIYITLKIETTFLNSFELIKHNLSGILGIDVKKTGSDKILINAITLKIPGAGGKKMKMVDREIYTATTSQGGIALDPLLNTLSGRLKMLKKNKQLFEEDFDVTILMKDFRYNLNKDFKIDEQNKFQFLYFCRTDSIFSKKLLKDKFALIQFLQAKAIEFNKIKQ